MKHLISAVAALLITTSSFAAEVEKELQYGNVYEFNLRAQIPQIIGFCWGRSR